MDSSTLNDIQTVDQPLKSKSRLVDDLRGLSIAFLLGENHQVSPVAADPNDQLC